MIGRLQCLKHIPRGSVAVLSRAALSSEVPTKTTSESVSKVDEFKDIETHTGQTFDKDDYRLSRFIGDKLKTVNPNWAINLIAEIPPTPVKARHVSCDGGGGPLGHPKVFINLDQPGNHSCGYCGLRFYQEHDHHH